MKNFESLHQKVQEMCDCHATTDPLKGMSDIASETDMSEAATKWIALAALHGITAGAKKISLHHGKDGTVKVNAEYRDAELPSPGESVGKAIIQSLKTITHIDKDKGSVPLALGIRDSSIDLVVKVKSEKEGEKITLEFPE